MTIVLVFCLVYSGMILGRIPRLRLDRTGVALLGAIALLVTDQVTLEEAGRSLDLPTLALLFGLMVLSAQLRSDARSVVSGLSPGGRPAVSSRAPDDLGGDRLPVSR